MIQPRLTESAYTISDQTLHHSGFNLEWFDELSIQPGLILDVGAYDFGDAVRFKDKFPDCDIYAFELDSRNFEKYHGFAQHLGITTVLCAISDKTNTIDGYYESHHCHGDNAQSTILAPTDIYRSNYPYVEHKYVNKPISQIRLDDYLNNKEISKNIDLLHLDVEGAEYQVLLGLGILRPKLIWLEYLIDGAWQGVSFAEVDKLLLDMNYKLELHAGFDKLWILN